MREREGVGVYMHVQQECNDYDEQIKERMADTILKQRNQAYKNILAFKHS